MNHTVQPTIKKLSDSTKIIVAADESPVSMGKRFESIGIENTFDNRLKWRKIILGTSGFGQYASGVILHPEMIEDVEILASLERAGVVLIVKIDNSLAPFNNSDSEKITLYASDVEQQLRHYHELGAGATKFRSVFNVGKHLPTAECIEANAKVQAHLAKCTQQAGLVPIVEPEVLALEGSHTFHQSKQVTSMVLTTVFEQLKTLGVHLSTMLLKPNMVVPGKNSHESVTPQQVAQATLECLEVVPDEVCGINFLSGGLRDEKAEVYLNAICRLAASLGKPPKYSASFGRGVLAKPLGVWAGHDANIKAVQEAFLDRVKRCSLARQGKL